MMREDMLAVHVGRDERDAVIGEAEVVLDWWKTEPGPPGADARDRGFGDESQKTVKAVGLFDHCHAEELRSEEVAGDGKYAVRATARARIDVDRTAEKLR